MMSALRLLVAVLLRVVLYGGVLCIAGWMLMIAPLVTLGFVLGIGLITLAVKLGV